MTTKNHPERTPEFQKLDRINARLEAAESLEEYEEIDAEFFTVDRATLRAWILDQLNKTAA